MPTDLSNPSSAQTSATQELTTTQLAPRILTVTSAADSGAGSLRATLAAAQAGDTIRFATGLANKTIRLTSGQLEIKKNLTIDATTIGKLTISGNNASRVFAVAENISASFKNLTVIEGKTTEGGGGIMVGKSGRLLVDGCQFNNNKAGIGGAIRLNYGAKATVLNSGFDSNDGTLAKSGFSAGAIATNGSGQLTVKGCRFTNNQGINGGAIYSLLGPLTIENSVFLNNRSGGNIGGGAVFTDGGNPVGPSTTTGGNIIVRGSWFEGNQTKGEGGALFLYGYKDKILLENSTVINNVADLDGKGIGRGGGLRANSELTIRNVTFANNKAATQGGGLWLDGNLPVNIVNSTFSNNQAVKDAGGAMFLKNGALVNIVNNTIADNLAGRACGAIWSSTDGAKITTLFNSILSNNTASDATQRQVGYQLKDGGGNIEFPSPFMGRRAVANSLIVDPKLGALQNMNGVLIRPLLAGSAAIGAAKIGAAPATDQRGVDRDGAPDAGAFELRNNLLSTNVSTLVEDTTEPIQNTETRQLDDTKYDILAGNAGRNTLRAGNGNDQVWGYGGDDTLVGGLGDDVLIGGEGSDRFVYRRLSDGVDLIRDFNTKQDIIDLGEVFRNAKINQDKQWNDYVETKQIGSDTIISVDISGGANHASKLVTLENVKAISLSAGNFLL